ncbi:hypothetical protein QUF72_08615 [Desulfobacterales bacterium HSG2]|nr:hypothetical protein [Desulfobacterales bacterium HSG2]
MPDKVKLFGNFAEMDDGEEHLLIKVKAATLNIDELWESGSLSASFLSSFWGKFFPSSNKASKAEMKDAVRYIAGELVGNAVKFSHEPDILIRIALCMSENELHFYVTNSVAPKAVGEYQEFIKKLADSDPDELYVEQMEKNALDDDSDESHMGFLTIILDYGACLAWKFEEHEDSGIHIATTMARLPVVRNNL